MISRLLVAIVLLIGFISSSEAALIDNGPYTTDTSTNLEWLDLTATTNLTYTYINEQLGAGGLFAGWRFATDAEAQTLFTDAGLPIVQSYTTPASVTLTAMQSLESLVGDTFATYNNGNPSYSNWSGFEGITSDAKPVGGSSRQRLGAYTFDFGGSPNYAIETSVASPTQGDLSAAVTTGSYLVRDVPPVPLPAAAWLFLSGLGGLSAAARRRKRGDARGASLRRLSSGVT